MKPIAFFDYLSRSRVFCVRCGDLASFRLTYLGFAVNLCQVRPRSTSHTQALSTASRTGRPSCGSLLRNLRGGLPASCNPIEAAASNLDFEKGAPAAAFALHGSLRDKL